MSMKAVILNNCYSRVFVMDPKYVSGELACSWDNWRSKLQVNKNLMTTLNNPDIENCIIIKL